VQQLVDAIAKAASPTAKSQPVNLGKIKGDLLADVWLQGGQISKLQLDVGSLLAQNMPTATTDTTPPVQATITFSVNHPPVVIVSQNVIPLDEKMLLPLLPVN